MSQSGDIPSFPRILLFWIVFRKVYNYCVMLDGICAIIAKHKVSGRRMKDLHSYWRENLKRKSLMSIGDNSSWLISSYNPWGREPRESLRGPLASKESRKCPAQSPGVGNIGNTEEDSEKGKNNLFARKILLFTLLQWTIWLEHCLRIS